MKHCGRFCIVTRPFPSSSFLPGHPLTSNLLLQVEYNVNGLLQHEQFGLRFLTAQMELTHAAQLLKSLVDVPHTESLAGVVCQPPHFLPLSFNLHWHIFIIIIIHITQSNKEPMAHEEGRKQQYWYSSLKINCQLWCAIDFLNNAITSWKGLTDTASKLEHVGGWTLFNI